MAGTRSTGRCSTASSSSAGPRACTRCRPATCSRSRGGAAGPTDVLLGPRRARSLAGRKQSRRLGPRLCQAPPARVDRESQGTTFTTTARSSFISIRRSCSSRPACIPTILRPSKRTRRRGATSCGPRATWACSSARAKATARRGPCPSSTSSKGLMSIRTYIDTPLSVPGRRLCQGPGRQRARARHARRDEADSALSARLSRLRRRHVGVARHQLSKRPVRLEKRAVQRPLWHDADVAHRPQAVGPAQERHARQLPAHPRRARAHRLCRDDQSRLADARPQRPVHRLGHGRPGDRQFWRSTVRRSIGSDPLPGRSFALRKNQVHDQQPSSPRDSLAASRPPPVAACACSMHPSSRAAARAGRMGRLSQSACRRSRSANTPCPR